MLEELRNLSHHFLEIKNSTYRRYFIRTTNLNHRMSMIVGPRGVGKTTTLVQSLLAAVDGDRFDSRILYIQSDHFSMGSISLYEIAEQFQMMGGKWIVFDEIHKYPEWSKELKSIYDTFPNLTIWASGSSALEIHKGSHDLTRRAVIYSMQGMSFKEYLEITHDIELPVYTLDAICTNHEKIANLLLKEFAKKNKNVMPEFHRYLQMGYYPYFHEIYRNNLKNREYAKEGAQDLNQAKPALKQLNLNKLSDASGFKDCGCPTQAETDSSGYFGIKDESIYKMTLEQNVHTTVESDLAAIYPQLTGMSLQKIKRLLTFIANAVPFTPNWNHIMTAIEVGDLRTLKTYFSHLEDAGLIRTLSKSSQKFSQLESPCKVYLENSNQLYAISSAAPEKGTVRETFFLNMLSQKHTVQMPGDGDFLVDQTHLFEVGGRKKDFDQIKSHNNSYLACDDLEQGAGRRIPLWLFGFLY